MGNAVIQGYVHVTWGVVVMERNKIRELSLSVTFVLHIISTSRVKPRVHDAYMYVRKLLFATGYVHTCMYTMYITCRVA